MNIANWKQQQLSELKQTLSALLRQQFKLRMQRTHGELTQTHLFKKTRKDIARVMTLISQRTKNEGK